MSTKPSHLSTQVAEGFQDEEVAAIYHWRPPYPAEVIDLLVELANGGPVLDLGCGPGDIARRIAPNVERVDAVDFSAAMVARGKQLPGGDHAGINWQVAAAEHAQLHPRLALPLAAKGVSVQSIEASTEMIDVMRSKPGGDQISVVIGDMADVDVPGQYQLVYLVYNTLFNLTGVGRQEDCFRNVARVLAPGGAFVIEAYVPEPENLEAQQRVEVRSVTEDSMELRMHRYNYEA